MLHLSFEAAEKLNSLFGEVNTLATQCKQARPPFESHGDLAGGVRGVLLILGRSDSQTVPEIAQQRCTSRQNIQIVVNRLKEEGLVELVSNPAHKRSARVRLTEKGRGLFQQIELAESRLLQEILTDLSQDELVLTTKCLQKLREALATELRQTNGAERIPVDEREIGANHKTPAVKRAKTTRRATLADEELLDENEAFPVNLL